MGTFLLGLIFWCEVVVRRNRWPDCIVLVEPFVQLHEVESPQLVVVKHANLHCMEEVGFREVAHYTRNSLKQVESSVNMTQWDFVIGCLGVGMAERSI